MYKITTKNTTDTDLLDNYPEIERYVIFDIVKEFACIMQQKECLSIDINKLEDQHTEYIVKGYVMTQEEYDKAMTIFRNLKSISKFTQDPTREYIAQLFNIIYQEPNNEAKLNSNEQ